MDNKYEAEVNIMLYPKHIPFPKGIGIQCALLLSLTILSPINSLAEEKQDVEEQSSSSLKLIGFFLALSRKNDCQLKSFKSPYGKPPFNRHKYNECLRKVRYLQNVDY